MKFHRHFLAAILILSGGAVRGQVIIGDNYNVTPAGTGFALNAGVNAGINPPTTTRLTGTAANLGLRYSLTTTTKVSTAYAIASNKLRVTPADYPGRFSLSTNDTTAFDFATLLGATTATAQNPAVYDLAIAVANNSSGTLRCSFALGAAEGDATTWDFGFQIYRTDSTDNFYTIGKRIDTTASGLASDLNSYITNTAPGTYGTEITLLMRVTDAGSETSTFHSRVQLSLDNGVTWIYDTDADSDLPSGWRLNGAGRYIMWDVAPNAGNVTYDNFSVRPVPVRAALISPADNATGIGANANLKATVSNTVPGNLTVTFFGREAPIAGADFLIPVLPDTQNYSDYTHDGLHSRWYNQIDWIVTNRVQKNIAYVAQLGDLVQHGDTGGGNAEEWGVATNAMYRLEDPAKTLLPYGIPYGCCVGNHDQEPNGDEDGTTTYYNRYFSAAHFAGKPYYGGHYSTNSDTFYNLFSAGGMDFIVFSYEYGRYGSGVLDWTDNILALYPNRRIIVMTHHAGSDYTPSKLSAQGAAIYDRLKTRANFFLMLGGHVFNGTGWGEGSRSDTYNGRVVHTLVSDYQNRPSGGNALMRLMYFSPANNLISIKTFSPYTGDFETDADSQFSFSYDMQSGGAGFPGTPYVALTTNTNVIPGSNLCFVWPALDSSKTYEWYVKVTDQNGNSLISPSRKFTTTVNAQPIANDQSVIIVGDQPSLLTLVALDANGDSLTFSTNSRPLRGLNSNFNPTNGTITYLPAHGFRGLDQFFYRASDSIASSGTAAMKLTIIAPTDANTNGLPDDWESKFGITDPNADADGDGQNNLAEYTANTNPTNALSFLKIINASSQTNGVFGLNWASIGGTRYRVQYSDDLANPFSDVTRFIDTEMDSAPYGAASTQSFTDDFTQTGFPTNQARYYRIKVVP